jgi:hypothetical protein
MVNQQQKRCQAESVPFTCESLRLVLVLFCQESASTIGPAYPGLSLCCRSFSEGTSPGLSGSSPSRDFSPEPISTRYCSSGVLFISHCSGLKPEILTYSSIPRLKPGVNSTSDLVYHNPWPANPGFLTRGGETLSPEGALASNL